MLSFVQFINLLHNSYLNSLEFSVALPNQVFEDTFSITLPLQVYGDSWSDSCLNPGGDASERLGVATGIIGNLTPSDKPMMWCSNIQEAIRRFTDTARKESQFLRVPPSDWDNMLQRLSIPLHFRLVHDTFDEKASAHIPWKEALACWSNWHPEQQLNANGNEVPNFVPLTKTEVYWLWCHFFGTPTYLSSSPVTTRIVACVKGKEGILGRVKVQLAKRPSEMTDEMIKSTHGFVPHPGSFGHCMTRSFAESFKNCRDYYQNPDLWDGNDGKGLWADDVLVEWRIWMDEPIDYLDGESAGAAIALAVGSLLARHRLHPSG